MGYVELKRAPWAGVVTLAMALAWAPSAHAEATPDEAESEAESVLVIIEAELPGASPAAVRARLAKQSGARILAITDLGHQDDAPRAVIAVAHESQDLVRVLYFDRSGHSETLSAPLIDDPAAVEAVVSTLASALLRRHLPQLSETRDGPTRHRADPQWYERMDEWRVYAALARVYPHRTYPLRIEDF